METTPVFEILGMTIDQAVALVASIAACLAALAAFWTIRQVKKQRELSYRPDLTISTTFVGGSKKETQDDGIPINWVREPSEPEGASNDWPSDYELPLRNVGLGVAKNVIVSWSMQLDKLMKEFNDLAQRTATPASFSFMDTHLFLNFGGQRDAIAEWTNQQSERIDYVLPASVDKEPTLLKLPDAYVLLASSFVYLQKEFRKKKIEVAPPKITVVFEYSDIAGTKRKSTFEINLDFPPMSVSSFVNSGGYTSFTGELIVTSV